MLEKLIETVKEHKSRLEILLTHRDMKPQLAAYIHEFLLNKDFEKLMSDINNREDYLANHIFPIEDLVQSEEFSINPDWPLYYTTGTGEDFGDIIVYITDHANKHWEISCNEEDIDRDIEKTSKRFGVKFKLAEEN